MKIRTYYWNDRILNPIRRVKLKLRRKPKSPYLRIGNAGDLFTRDIIQWKYGKESENIKKRGKRILIIGSISHQVMPGDIICGIGTRGETTKINHASAVSVYALRGPISCENFRRQGYDLSNLKSIYDPGLLARFIFHDLVEEFKDPIKNNLIFIPHYKDMDRYPPVLENGIRTVNVDSEPKKLAAEILQAEHVFSSSLHGIIFAHSLGRPASLVKNLSNEISIKYKDYYASIDQSLPKIVDNIREDCLSSLPISPVTLKLSADDFYLPDIDELILKEICV